MQLLFQDRWDREKAPALLAADRVAAIDAWAAANNTAHGSGSIVHARCAEAAENVSNVGDRTSSFPMSAAAIKGFSGHIAALSGWTVCQKTASLITVKLQREALQRFFVFLLSPRRSIPAPSIPPSVAPVSAFPAAKYNSGKYRAGLRPPAVCIPSTRTARSAGS